MMLALHIPDIVLRHRHHIGRHIVGLFLLHRLTNVAQAEVGEVLQPGILHPFEQFPHVVRPQVLAPVAHRLHQRVPLPLDILLLIVLDGEALLDHRKLDVTRVAALLAALIQGFILKRDIDLVVTAEGVEFQLGRIDDLRLHLIPLLERVLPLRQRLQPFVGLLL